IIGTVQHSDGRLGPSSGLNDTELFAEFAFLYGEFHTLWNRGPFVSKFECAVRNPAEWIRQEIVASVLLNLVINSKQLDVTNMRTQSPYSQSAVNRHHRLTRKVIADRLFVGGQ